jgi:hypothetical protein
MVDVMCDKISRPIPFVFVSYRHWRVVSLDASTLKVADTEANRLYFGRPGASRGQSALQQLRVVGLVESGTRSIFGVNVGPYEQGEITLAKTLTVRLRAGDALFGRFWVTNCGNKRAAPGQIYSGEPRKV